MMQNPFRRISLRAVLSIMLALFVSVSFIHIPGLTAPFHASAESAITSDDSTDTWDPNSATIITLSGETATVKGSGASISGSIVTIEKKGTYVLQGSLKDGQLLIDAGKKDTIHLVLNGASITSLTTAPLYAKKAGKIILTLAPETDNSLMDAEAYVYSDGETEPDAALFVKNNLSINGSGSLTVAGQYLHGIVAKDNLVIADGDIRVTANDVGIRGRDSLTVEGGKITVNSQGDALQSNNAEDAKLGWIAISGGDFQLTSLKDGIQAETRLTITGGTFHMATGGAQAGETISIPQSPVENGKGLKAGGDLIISGGTFTVDAMDDAIHANGSVILQAGTYTLATGDDGIHADGDATIQSGEITISESYEGIEAANILIQGGTLNLAASDDGFNAAGGNDGPSPTGDWRGRGGFEASGNYAVTISGGTVNINADGDGIDSNGAIYLEGGELRIDGPTLNGNAAMDCNGDFEVRGGILVAAGSAGMAQVPGTGSTQPSLMIYFNSNGLAGKTISLTDASGNEIFSHNLIKDFQTILISTPELVQGSTYTLSIDGQTQSEIALFQNATVLSSDGSPVTAEQGFPQRPGGHGPRK